MAQTLRGLVAGSVKSISLTTTKGGVSAVCSLEDALPALAQARVVYFGERHHNPNILKVYNGVALGRSTVAHAVQIAHRACMGYGSDNMSSSLFKH